jgi:RHS repeat-associated protein
LGDLSYGYDAAGQRISMGGSLATVNLPNEMGGVSIDAANRLTAFGTQTLTYDANGNLTGDGTQSYVWNARNQLTQINDLTGSPIASFSYDALGRRQTKTVNGVSTGYVYDGLNIVQELNGTNVDNSLAANVRANYISGGLDEVFAQLNGSGPSAIVSSYLTDALGSTIQMTDASGNKVAGYTYDPYGNTTADMVVNNPFQYTGRENDGTGLYYYRARYYSPAMGRFISSDPIGLAGGINTYGYVDGNPIGGLDPLGLATVHIWDFHDMRNVGHSSMTLNDGTYISWWPKGSDAEIFNTVAATTMQSLSDDIRNEGRQPDRNINVDGLDEAAIRRWWDDFKRNKKNKYAFLGQNCSATVAEGLDAGGGATAAGKNTWGRPIPPVWSPSAVKDYADRIMNPGPKLPIPKRAPGWN